MLLTFSEKIKFTVVIPTRERCDTLISCISSVLSQDYSNYDILVSDNASEDSTKEVVNSLASPRIRYVNTGRRVSMSHNWEYALSHVDAGWITILGDDDALVPGALRRVSQLIELTGAKAIRSNGASYSWPSLLEDKYGRLNFSFRRDFRVIDSTKALLEVLRGNKNYNTLPVLYNGGFIDIELIKKAKSISDVFFHSMTPDVYSAMVFALLTDNYVYSYEALAINGASHHSNGTSVFSRKKISKDYNPSAKFYSEGNIALHGDIPYADSGSPVTSLHACILEAYLQAERFFKKKDLNVPTYADHLKTILHEQSDRNQEIIEWGKRFAEQHSLDFSEIKANEALARKVSTKRIERLLYIASSLSFQGTDNIPLANVYEASIVIGFLKHVGFSPLTYCKSLSNRVRRKLAEKASRKDEEKH